MKAIGIQIERFPYEEPYLVNLGLTASNGNFQGTLEFFCNASELADIGKALSAVRKTIPDEYSYEIGSTKPEDRFAYYFALRVYTRGLRGNCAHQVVINNNQQEPDEGACRFSIQTDRVAINRLGALLLEFAELKHRQLHWTPSGKGDGLVGD